MYIDGKKIAEEILAEVAQEVKNLPKPPRLAAVLVGPSTSSGQGAKKFLELKKKAAEKAGIEFRLYEFPADITTQKLRKEIVHISKAGVNGGVLIELPLPEHINAQYILNAIPEKKDVDVLSQRSQGAFFTGRSPVLPPAVEAVKIIFEKYDISAKGKSCAVFGYGLLVGRPIAHWLSSQGATVSTINEFTLNPGHYSLDADIIISGVGKPNLITADMVKNGAAVIDFGYQKLGDLTVGDVDSESVASRASLITPVPGGVGPIVVAAVFKNMLILIK